MHFDSLKKSGPILKFWVHLQTFDLHPSRFGQGERDATMVEGIYADLLKRYPANFATGSWQPFMTVAAPQQETLRVLSRGGGTRFPLLNAEGRVIGPD